VGSGDGRRIFGFARYPPNHRETKRVFHENPPPHQVCAEEEKPPLFEVRRAAQ